MRRLCKKCSPLLEPFNFGLAPALGLPRFCAWHPLESILSMCALYIEKHDLSHLQLCEIPTPVLQPGEVLVQVQASGLNRSDVLSVEGRFRTAVLPRVVGRDFAGKIVQGPAQQIGLEVWGSGGDLGVSRNGTHAEFLVIPQSAISARPKKLTAQQAAAVGVPFVTAFCAVNRLGAVQQGEWVIISGAAGAVGQAAIQLAHTRGAKVIALVKNSTGNWVTELGGVQAVAQSDRGNLTSVVREVTSGQGAHVALNGVGASICGVLFDSLAPGGRQVLYSAAGGGEFPLDISSFYHHRFALFGLDTQAMSATECAQILNELTPLFDSGALRPPAVAHAVPFSQAPQAYQRVAAGQPGKVVLVFT
jgi:NADPH:quinone reductase